MPEYLTSEDVADILSLLDSLPFDELTLRTGSFELTLRRAADGGWTQATQVLSPPTVIKLPGERPASVPASQSTASVTKTPSVTEATGPTQGGKLIDVRSPLPGTFYRAPRPGAPPFIEVGGEVTGDTVVGIIETMKLMNSVYASCSGRIAEICFADAQFAGQDAVLMRIDPGAGQGSRGR